MQYGYLSGHFSLYHHTIRAQNTVIYSIKAIHYTHASRRNFLGDHPGWAAPDITHIRGFIPFSSIWQYKEGFYHRDRCLRYDFWFAAPAAAAPWRLTPLTSHIFYLMTVMIVTGPAGVHLVDGVMAITTRPTTPFWVKRTTDTSTTGYWNMARYIWTCVNTR